MPPRLIRLLTRWPKDGLQPPTCRHVFVPALDRFPPALRETLALLPVADINGSLLEALAAHGAHMIGGDLVAGIFAADPFLDLTELVERLRGAGIAHVANFPTLQHFDGATADGLAAVGYDVQTEFGILGRFAASGLETIAYVATLAAAEAALASGIHTLAYHPGLPPLPASERAALERMRALATDAGVHLLVHASTGTDDAGDQPIRP